MLPVIPMRKSRKKRIGVDRSLYRLRNRVERCFNELKKGRRVATRYDKWGRASSASLILRRSASGSVIRQYDLD